MSPKKPKGVNDGTENPRNSNPGTMGGSGHGKGKGVGAGTNVDDPTQRTDRSGDTDSGSATPVVRAESIGALSQTDPAPKPRRKRRSKTEIESERLAAERVEQAATSEALEKLRENTSATVGVFIDGFDPLFKYVIPPELADKEKFALTHCWTLYLTQDGVEIPPLKAAVFVTAIVVVPRTILAIVDYFVKRKEKKDKGLA